MKNFNVVLSMILALSIVFTGCDKDDDDGGVATSLICDGGESDSYFPLEQGNSWEYKGGLAGLDVVISGTETEESVTYTVVKYSEGGFNDFEHLLREASNGDIYRYYTNEDKEYLYIPANPSSGQTIATFAGGNYRKVISANTSFSTDECSYTNVLEIASFSDTDTKTATTYYVKGIGMVGEPSSFGTGKTQLTEITLN